MLQNFKKTKIRYLVREQLNLMDFSVIREKSRKIYHKLLDLKEIKDAKTIFVYISLKDEVQTFDLINHFLKKGKKVIVPVIVSNKMELVKFKENTKLVAGKYGILEPKEKDKYKGEIDVALIPGLGFSLTGKRIGKGGGYYDEFLSIYKDIYKIGLCFGVQIMSDENVPVEPHDVKMDLVIYD